MPEQNYRHAIHSVHAAKHGPRETWLPAMALTSAAVFADIARPLMNLSNQSHGNLRAHHLSGLARSARSFIRESKSTSDVAGRQRGR